MIPSIALVVAAAMLCAPIAVAQQSVRLVVPFPPGGGTDTIARLLAPHLAEGLGRAVVIENRPGAYGTIGASYVARGEPDGSRLLLSNAALAESAANPDLSFDPTRELRSVIQLTASGYFLLAHTGLGARDAADLRALAKQRPRGLNCGGAPGGPNLGCEGLRLALGDIVTIHYQGLAALSKALVSGEVDVMFAGRRETAQLLGTGRAVVLATVTDQPALPPHERVPLLRETYPGIVLDAFTGILAAAGTPDDVVHQYNRQLNRILTLPEVRATLLAFDYGIVGGEPDALAGTLARGVEQHRRLAPSKAPDGAKR